MSDANTGEGTLPRLELERVFLHDAAEIIAAREKAKVIHHTKDIKASGNEVESTVRAVLRKKLARTYYVGHGHIVDSRMAFSTQLDVIISDNENTPVLLKTEDGTEYMPFESVYAVGEVKSTYYKKDRPIHALSDTLRRIKAGVHRERVPPNYMGHGISAGFGMSSGVKEPYRNPLFSFMVFVDSGDFAGEDVASPYRETPVDLLPNIVCFLNGGVLINQAQATVDGKRVTKINPTPEFNSPGKEGVVNQWSLLLLGTEGTRCAYSLVALHFFLAAHLSICKLMAPDMTAYLGAILGQCVPAGGQVIG